ncbi:sterol desaturase family protein [Coleofasciculus chthonoplastes]|uniref:sterol desaturase family protein n=1 Tax=Coleofasciculus chthonoplastes TaxID=64178 RepID=UPI0032FDBAFD
MGITQILAWTVIGNAYNLEGHSSLSIFFIASDFHDLHHTSFKGNYGIHGFWDRVFNTLNPPTKKSGIISPVASLEKMAVN